MVVYELDHKFKNIHIDNNILLYYFITIVKLNFILTCITNFYYHVCYNN